MRTRDMTRRRFLAASAATLAGASVSSCAGVGALGGGRGGTTVRVAIVGNPQMEDMRKLTGVFERDHPGIRIEYVTLPENQARAKITQSVATHSGQFDVVMISNYETPIWARNGWLVNLEPYIADTPDYVPDDIVPAVREALSYRGHMHSVPFYGETSFLMYRRDIFDDASLTMPDKPTWADVRGFARKLGDRGEKASPVCLRGLPGWGEVLAPLGTVINAFGGRWFDRSWHAQLDSPEVHRAVRFYVNLLRQHGEPGAASSGFTECLTYFGQGNAAMMYDATSAAGSLESPDTSRIAGKDGYVPAPAGPEMPSQWLYSWSLAIPKTSRRKKAAWEFLAWATSKSYIRLVGERLGWAQVPPGSRLSTYDIREYQKAARAFAKPTLQALRDVQPENPTAKPVPYTGLQFVDIPEFIDLGTRVSPLVAPGLAATAFICAIFSWNEFFFAVNLTSIRGPTAPVFLVSFITSEGLYWARLSAAATLAVLPVLIIGWSAQKQLVRGLSMGAIK